MNQDFMKTKPILPLVLSMSLPMMLSMLINSLYNIVDSMFVARLGEQALTAVSLVYPLQSLVVSVAVGFGVGINAAIAFYLGAGEKEKADRSASSGLLFGILHGLVLTLFGMLGIRNFLEMFTSDAVILQQGLQYGYIVLGFSVVVTSQITFEKIYQAVGNVVVPMVCLAAGCIVNIILDPLLIFGLGPVARMEVTGAAIATVIGQCVTLVMYILWYLRRDMGLSVTGNHMRPQKDVMQKIYLVGVPSALTLALPSLLTTILNGLAAAFSPAYILILGVYFRLQSFIYLPANGIVQGMRPIISYNYGAGLRLRMKKILKICTCMIFVIMCIGMLLFMLLPSPIMKMFTEDTHTVTEGAVALRLISLGFVVSTVSVISSGALEALGQGMLSFLISILRYLVIIIPAAVIGVRMMGVCGIWMAFPIAEVITAAASAWIFVAGYRRCMRMLDV